ncbi:hypothetical protein [Rhizobium sp. N4311]|uniref:hypothetical protein n=1 Tax=Rhizobium sp. N4311 TaxID=1703972 RepID=UPI000B9668DF|nr:hypothetical protein [Rhizobium sp. N4311]OYD03706.1 hypothetical protein AMK08_CH101724 [Rhizobium sp. N4311]
MPNETIPAAAEGLPNAKRRTLLFGLAAASTAAAVAVAPSSVRAQLYDTSGLEESAELNSAYNAFCDACAEFKDAQDRLEWLADEWRHQWPLAPEELLLGANAQDGRYTMPAERDIIGRYLVRDTSDLTKRLAPKFRRENRKTCFVLRTADEERGHLKKWTQSKPKGRTAKALERNRAYWLKAIQECELRIQLAEQYEAETARLRRVSGADAARQSVKDADALLRKAADDVSRCEAWTLVGLGMKAEALTVAAGDLLKLTWSDATPLGQLSRFVASVADVAGRASI